MRNLPTITKNLLIINVLAFLASYVFSTRGIDFNNIFGLHFLLAPDFRIYQFFTYMFMHGSWTHLFFNMFALWMFGCVMENTWGPKKFLFYYIVCGIGAGLMQETVQFVQYAMEGLGAYQQVRVSADMIMPMGQYLNSWTTVGASGAIYGILLGFGMLYPNERIFIIPIPFPIKAKWFVLFYVAVELFSAMSTSNDGVAHFAHLGGMLFGYLLIHYWRTHPQVTPFEEWNRKRSAFDRFKDYLGKRNRENFTFHRNDKFKDYDHQDNHNPEKEAEKQKEIDRILDKIRKSGYDSLTPEEKKTLFDASK